MQQPLASSVELEHMVASLRVTELQAVLQVAGRSKIGKKQELYERVLAVLREKPANYISVANKIQELCSGGRRPVQMNGDAAQLPTSTMRPTVPLGRYSGSTGGQMTSGRYVSSGGQMTTTSSSAAASQLRVPTVPAHQAYAQATQGRTAAAAAEQARQFLSQHAPSMVRVPLPSAASLSVGGGSRAVAMPGLTATATAHVVGRTLSDAQRLRVTPLPFYEQLDNVIPLTELAVRSTNKHQEWMNAFQVPPNYFETLNYKSETEPLPRIELQLRFFLVDLSAEQKDDFPPQCAVRIDEQVVVLPSVIPTNKPGVEAKRPSRPVNVTPYCQLARASGRPYRISVTWTADERRWAVSLWVVRRNSAAILLRWLKTTRTRYRSAAETRKQINGCLSLDHDDDIATDSLRVSLTCPLGKTLIKDPCKPRSCKHLKCFDASLFLMMNEKRPSWTCPVCDKPALFNDLVLEDYYIDVIKRLRPGVNEIEVYKDGTWREVDPDADSDDDAPKQPAVKRTTPTPAVVVSSAPPPPMKASPSVDPSEIEIIDLDDSDDEEEDSGGISRAPRPRSVTPPSTRELQETITAKIALGRAEMAAARKRLSPARPPPSQSSGSAESDSIIVLGDSPPACLSASADEQRATAAALAPPPRKRFAAPADSPASGESPPAQVDAVQPAAAMSSAAGGLVAPSLALSQQLQQQQAQFSLNNIYPAFSSYPNLVPSADYSTVYGNAQPQQYGGVGTHMRLPHERDMQLDLAQFLQQVNANNSLFQS